jgi:sugar porter (SP) family MFS transporter
MMHRHSSSHDDQSLSWFIVKVTAMASLGGCLFGYDMGAISGALPQLAAHFDLSSNQQELVVSILYLGGGLGACVGGTICDSLGRQKTILGTDVIFATGALILYCSQSITQLYIGRLVVGFAAAVSGVADVSYLHEIAPPRWRGAIVSVNEACISLGFLLAYVAGYFYSSADDESWRIIFGWAGVLACVQFVGMWGLPESPIWLEEQDRIEESVKAWEQINGRPAPPISQELQDMQEDNVGQVLTPNLQYASDSTTTNNNHIGHRPVHDHHQHLTFIQTMVRYRQQIYLALFLSVTQQLCGQTNILSYGPIIFAQVGADEDVGWSTLAIGIVKFIVTLLVIWKIEYLGRRFLLLAGMTIIALGLLCLIIAFGGYQNPDTWSARTSSFQLALPGVLMVVCGYSMSFGPLTWLLTSELFPTEIRGRALGASTIVTYLCASLVTNTFLSAQSWWGPSKVFAIYFICTAMGIVFSYLAIPDTGEKTVEEVEEAIHQMWWWRFDRVALQQTDDNEPPVTEPYVLHSTPDRQPQQDDEEDDQAQEQCGEMT